ncbi:unnamed protein product [Trichobilharzia regenti]|nr:unnamed protein product [Trichobilharzia regenti]
MVDVPYRPAVSDNGKHVVMLSREEVIKLAAATVSDKTNPVVSLSKDGESISQRIKIVLDEWPASTLQLGEIKQLQF